MGSEFRPMFLRLARATVIANTPVFAVLLMLARTDLAGSLCSGAVTGLTIYALLALSIRKATAMILVDPSLSRSRVPQGRSSLATLSILKLFGVACALFVLFSVARINLPCFLTGFLLTQMAVTLAMIRHGQ